MTKSDLGSRAWIRIGGRLVSDSDLDSQLEQTSNHRDMDSQYATVDQLAEITDTMASLWDAILGLGQRIDGHQAQPFPISGSTPHDSTPPPPPPPSSGPTVHGQTETTPHSVVAPAPIIDNTQACIDRLEQRIRSLHVFDGVIG